MHESFRGSRKFFRTKIPDSAALYPGYELGGAQSAPYLKGHGMPCPTLRSLRLNLLRPLFHSPPE
jgi:hypothetical protein